MEYTKADLVDYLYNHSRNTKQALNAASIEKLEEVITRCNRWDDFYKELPTWRAIREGTKRWNRALKAIKAAK